mmetsp:Transcript_10285/g.12387  ORF Transcript_10285/g.12387 Transcript_10285/m.12387 type:complete len:228 (+) Transcript_10285:141-824(+)
MTSVFRIRRTRSAPLPLGKDELPDNLAIVLDSKKLRRRFKDFLMDKFAIESYLFYDSLELYSKIKKQQWRTKQGTLLLNKFVAEGSQYEVNLSGKVRDELLNTSAFTASTFDEAKAEIFNLMKTNFFDNFCKWLAGDDEHTVDERRVTMKHSEVYQKSPDFKRVTIPSSAENTAAAKAAKERARQRTSIQNAASYPQTRRLSSARRLSLWESWMEDEDELQEIMNEV